MAFGSSEAVGKVIFESAGEAAAKSELKGAAPRRCRATRAVEVPLDPLIIDFDPSGLVCGALAHFLYVKGHVRT